MSMLTRSLESTQFSRSPNRRKQISLVGREEKRTATRERESRTEEEEASRAAAEDVQCAPKKTLLLPENNGLRKHTRYLDTHRPRRTSFFEPFYASILERPEAGTKSIFIASRFSDTHKPRKQFKFRANFFVLICQSLLPKLAPFCKQTY